MLLFTVIFGKLAGLPSDGVPYPIFSFAALVPWTFFSTAISGSITSLVINTNLITKVYFPRISIPVTPVLARLVDFTISFVLLVLMANAFGLYPTLRYLYLPLLVLLMATTAIGVGIWLSALAIQYRDVQYAVPFLIQILMYVAPVVWPVSLIGDKLGGWAPIIRLVYGLYPMAGVIEGFRSVLLATRPIPWDLLIVGLVSSIILTLSGLVYFGKKEEIFADVA